MTPPSHDRLVARLLADARPVRPLWSPHARLAVWLALEVVLLGIAARFGLREDLGDHLHRPLFVLELIALLAAGGVAAALALRAAVPGLGSSRWVMTLAVLLVSVAVGLVSLEPARHVASTWRFVASGVQCVSSILAFASIPWITLVVAVRRGMPLSGATAGAYAGAAAILLAAAAVRIACPLDDGLHLLTWHMTPIGIGTVVSGMIGARRLDCWDV